MKQVLSASVARGISAICAVFLVAGGHTAQAGVNVWTSHGPPGGSFFALAIDPITPNTLYVGTDDGLLKSTDAGRTWGDARLNRWVSALAIDPMTPSTLYASADYYVFKSSNSGATWQAPNSGEISCNLTALAIHPITPRTLYVAAQYHDDSNCGGIFRSTDAGATWERVAVQPLPSTSYPLGEGRSVLALAIDPVTPSTLYAGTGGGTPAVEGHGVFKSTDAGVTWGPANIGLPPSTCVSALALDPLVPSTLYAAAGGFFCTASGVFKSVGGVFKSTDSGATWKAATLTEAGVSSLAIDPTISSTLYSGTWGDGVFKSTDAGATWNALNAGLTNTLVATLAIDPLTPSRLYAGTSSGVFSIQQGVCIGDCSGDGTVTVDEVITLVNIALGDVPPAACPSGVPSGAEVDVVLIMQSVNSALAGCTVAGPTEVLSGTLFVTDSIANKVHAMDAATGDILASADTEEHPVGVEKADGKVFVANEASDTVSVFDAATLSPRTVIPTCSRPHHTAVSPDGARVYVACVGTNKVAVVDAQTDTLAELLTTGVPGAMTHQPWPTRDGQRLWVTNFGTNDITEIDLQSGAVLRSFPLGGRPIEVVVPADASTAYVSIPDEDKIKVFDLETNQLKAEPTVLAPENLMLSRDGKTILASWSGLHSPTAVSVFSTATLTSVAVSLPRGTASHTDLTADAKFGFVSLAGRPQGIAVVDIEAAAVHAFYPIPGAGLVHAVRYAPGPP
jgi:YVTN family beta-propeller protein